MEKSIDLRAAGYCSLTGKELDEAVRTLHLRKNVFAMLVMARGLEDELTQTAWLNLSEAVDELITLADR
jgi:hypothetical protein